MDLSGDAWEVPGGITASEPNLPSSPPVYEPRATCVSAVAEHQVASGGFYMCLWSRQAQGAGEVLMTGETKAWSPTWEYKSEQGPPGFRDPASALAGARARLTCTAASLPCRQCPAAQHLWSSRAQASSPSAAHHCPPPLGAPALPFFLPGASLARGSALTLNPTVKHARELGQVPSSL